MIKINLDTILNSHIVDDLKEMAKTLRIKGYSKLKKAELVDLLSEEIADYDRLEKACLTATENDILNLTRVTKEDVYINPESFSYQYWARLCIVFVTVEGRVHTPVEIENTIKVILMSKKFEKARTRAEWINRYALACVNLYSIIELDKFVEIVNAQTDLEVEKEEVINWCNLRYQNRGCEMYFYQKGYLMCDSYGDNVLDVTEDYRPMLSAQKGKPYYVPDQEELLNYEDDIYVEENTSFRNMLNFIIRKMRRNEDDAYDYAAEIQFLIRNGNKPGEILDDCARMGLDFLNDNQFSEFMSYLMEMNNNTRIPENRGYTPNEMNKLQPQNEVISEETLRILRNMGVMGAGMEQESNVIPFPVNRQANPKVYPNDPCPCGSGKKYKKCCGKN